MNKQPKLESKFAVVQVLCEFQLLLLFILDKSKIILSLSVDT